MNTIGIVILIFIIALGVACAAGVAAGVMERRIQEEFDEEELCYKKNYINTRRAPRDEDHRNR